MKLKLKKEYLNYSIISRFGKVYLTDLDPEKYEEIYKSGYSNFFDVIKETKKVEDAIIDSELKIEDKDDTNK
jgi:hypothetical protein